MKIPCLIVDDSPAAIELICLYAQMADLEIVGQETDPRTALKKLETGAYAPALIFLDIQMPFISGIQFANMLTRKLPIVLTTGAKEYGPEAFEIGAIDYLHKPFSFSRFTQSIEKAKEKLQLGHSDPPPLSSRCIFVPGTGRNNRIRIDMEDINYIKGDQSYVHIFTRKGNIYTYRTVAEMERRLTLPQFIRIHKSYIVNIERVSEIKSDSVIIGNDVELSIGPLYKDRLRPYI